MNKNLINLYKFLIILLILNIQACQKAEIPEWLFARWESHHQLYQDCYMIIEKELMTIAAADKSIHKYEIQKITFDNKDDKNKIVIQSKDEHGVDFIFDLHYLVIDNKHQLYFLNQPDVLWHQATMNHQSE